MRVKQSSLIAADSAPFSAREDDPSIQGGVTTCKLVGEVGLERARAVSRRSQLLRSASDTMAEYLASIFGTEKDK